MILCCLSYQVMTSEADRLRPQCLLCYHHILVQPHELHTAGDLVTSRGEFLEKLFCLHVKTRFENESNIRFNKLMELK